MLLHAVRYRSENPDRYHGITLGSSVQEHLGLWSMYRFHIEDPVRFTTSLKVSIEHGLWDE